MPASTTITSPTPATRGIPPNVGKNRASTVNISVGIQGTASTEAKTRLTHAFNIFCRQEPVYGASIARRIALLEANLIEPGSGLGSICGTGARVMKGGASTAELVCEVVCEEGTYTYHLGSDRIEYAELREGLHATLDMCGPHKIMHAGCMTYLVIMYVLHLVLCQIPANETGGTDKGAQRQSWLSWAIQLKSRRIFM
jgi:hypothetical protein